MPKKTLQKTPKLTHKSIFLRPISRKNNSHKPDKTSENSEHSDYSEFSESSDYSEPSESQSGRLRLESPVFMVILGLRLLCLFDGDSAVKSNVFFAEVTEATVVGSSCNL